MQISCTGDVWTLGDHRLMVGDSGSEAAVEKLMNGERAGLCFTSPPYLSQRLYNGRERGNWDALMASAFSNLPMTPDGQVLVNLGLVHGAGEWHPYWTSWIEKMRADGWRRFGWYVWDSGWGLPGDWSGRLAPSFEFIFHFNKTAGTAQKVVLKKPENVGVRYAALRQSNGSFHKTARPWSSPATHKIPDSVIRICRDVHRQNAVEAGHPARFPVGLPLRFIESYSEAGEIVFEPFGGSGTTIIAAEQSGRKCYAMEIVPAYVDMAIERWMKASGREAFRDDGATFSELAGPRRRAA